MLRIHCLQLWWNLSDPAMEEELHERPLYREFAGLAGAPRLPDEATILRFRHLLEKLQLAPKTGTLVDATQIAAPSSTKNKHGARDPEMYQTKKGNQWHFGMKAHIGVDADSGRVHSVIGTGANVHDVTQAVALFQGDETDVFADAGYQGIAKREEAKDLVVNWHIAMRPGKRREVDDAVCAEQPVDGAQANLRGEEMSAPAERQAGPARLANEPICPSNEVQSTA